MSKTYIKEGMSWGEIVGILNGFIATVEVISKAIGGCVVDNKIDYNSLANRPTINGKTISGDETSESLGIELSSDTLIQIRQTAENIATQVANNMLGDKASANISQLQNADADVSEICFFINDKNGVAKKIDIATLKAYLGNSTIGNGDVIVNNENNEDFEDEFAILKEDLSTFKANTRIAITQIEDSLKQEGIALSDCSDVCREISHLALSNNITKG